MSTVRRFIVFSKCNQRLFCSSSRLWNSSSPQHTPSRLPTNDAEEDPIPTTPTWSVHALLASYPRPRITHEELTKLHTLSALVPPAEGSEAEVRMRSELEELVRLVEAVRLVDTTTQDQAIQGNPMPIPDGRIWEEGKGMKLSSNTREVEFDDPEVESGRTLLEHAHLTRSGFYVVEADRRKK